MLRLFFASLAAPLLLAGCATPPVTAPPPETSAPAAGVVSAADPRAEEAGREILAQGGSATDAAVAVMLALTVVEPQSSGIGGGGFLVHGDADGTVTTLDGRETAPAAATPRWFLNDAGNPLSFREAVRGGLSVGIPGNIALAAEAHRRDGKLAWADLFGPAIRLAREGWAMNRRFHASLDGSLDHTGRDPYAEAMFYGGDGGPLPVGTRLTNHRLAETLERIAREGPETFYRSDPAEAMARLVASATPGNRGMTSEDVASYRAKEREPVCGTYRAYRICGMGPPSSGGVAVFQILKQLERFDLAALGPDSPVSWHLFLESQRLAYADREKFLADPDYVSVPVSGLMDPAYIATRSAMISPDSALDDVAAGQPAGAAAFADGDEGPESGTSHFVTMDAQGNSVSYTSTIEGAFGSGLMFGGFYLNNGLTDFSFSPVVDGEPVANRVEAGKRPRSSMAPTIVYDPQGRPFLLVGAAGGPTIPVQVARSIIGVIDFDLPVDAALGLPLIMANGDTVLVEQGSRLKAMIPALRALGHGGSVARPVGLKANAALRTPQGWVTARDPRVEALLATG